MKILHKSIFFVFFNMLLGCNERFGLSYDFHKNEINLINNSDNYLINKIEIGTEDENPDRILIEKKIINGVNYLDIDSIYDFSRCEYNLNSVFYKVYIKNNISSSYFVFSKVIKDGGDSIYYPAGKR